MGRGYDLFDSVLFFLFEILIWDVPFTKSMSFNKTKLEKRRNSLFGYQWDGEGVHYTKIRGVARVSGL